MRAVGGAPGRPAAQRLRERCHGVVPLSARLEPWMTELCEQPQRLAQLIAQHGSPVNLIETSAIGRNAAELAAAADKAGVELGIYLARKANKTIAVVDEARRLGLGVDLASERELRQVLDRGLDPSELVMSAAVKPRALLELCAQTSTTVVLDNGDETEALCAIAGPERATPVALRLAPELSSGRIETRFGLPAAEWLRLLERLRIEESGLRIDGVHFHLDGYSAADRVGAIAQALDLIDELRSLGHSRRYVDIGGGIPVSYLDVSGQWSRFRSAHRSALLGDRETLTYEGHGLGLRVDGDVISGELSVYPPDQAPVRGEWLDRILGAPLGRGTVAQALGSRDLSLRCEPGRSLLDGCGITAARVEFRKRRRDGTWLIGLAMNRTQCRSAADEFPVDPLLLRPEAEAGRSATAPIAGYLVGAYCIERELLSWRRMQFPDGVALGDIIVFPNTGGYMMHILESASHQIPLARNLVIDGEGARVDLIDA